MAAKAKLTPTDREDIARRFGKGGCAAVLAEEFHVTENCIRVTAKKHKAGGAPKGVVVAAPSVKLHKGADVPLRSVFPEGIISAPLLGKVRDEIPAAVITGIPGIGLPTEFKDMVADMCRQAFEEKIKDALDAIFFKP